MQAFVEQDLLTLLPTILVSTAVVLAPLAYYVVHSRSQKSFGEYR